MKYTVLWTPDTERTLADLWAESESRKSITNAANEIDRRLATAPDSEGESRSDNRRVMFVAPLGVSFIINARLQTVLVLAVWKYAGNGREWS